MASLGPATAGDPPVSEIRILPHYVTIEGKPGTVFRLEAEIYADLHPGRAQIPEDEDVGGLWWKSTKPWLVVDGQYDRAVSLRVVQWPVPSDSAKVLAVSGNATSAAPAFVVAANAGGNPPGDLLKGDYTPDQRPDVALASGEWNLTGKCAIRLFAFVRRAQLGSLSGPCPETGSAWSLAVFSASGGSLIRQDVLWTPGAEDIDVSPRPPPRILPIVVQLLLAAEDPGAAKEYAEAEVEVSNAMLAASRVGVALNPIETASIATTDPTDAADCVTAGQLTKELDKPGVLNVYYLNAMGNNLRGLTCATMAVEGATSQAIYLSYQQRMAGTLAHEVGHALGLMLPGNGHTDGKMGFDATNIMLSYIDDEFPTPQRSFSLGQAFRMNADSGSWLNWAVSSDGSLVRAAIEPRLACPCGATRPSGLCPGLAMDVTYPSSLPTPTATGECEDQVVVPTAAGEEPVGILGGRRWPTPPGTCTALVDNGTAPLSGTLVSLLFEDVTRPGACPSWVAVFYRTHGLLYRTLEETSTSSWSDAADVWMQLAADAPPEQRGVEIQVFQPMGTGDLTGSLITVGKIYGPQNRTGIALSFVSHAPGTSCPRVSTTTAEFDLCYGATSPSGAVSSYGARRVVQLPANARQDEVLFAVGRLLGLPEVTTADGFKNNIMQQFPADRGRRLTLGQAFRINAMVDPSLPKCDASPLLCPDLALDGSP